MDKDLSGDRAPRWITLSPRILAGGVAAAVALLAFAGLAVNLAPLAIEHPSKGMLFLLNQFQVDGEGNIPAWVSSMLFLANGVLLALIGAAERGGVTRRLGWACLSAIFILLSIDEAVSLHEPAGRAFWRLTGLGGDGTFAWLIPAVPVVLCMGLVFLRLIIGLPRRTRVMIVLAGAIFLSGAMGFEVVGWSVGRDPDRWDWAYQMSTLAEEVLELAGQALFFHALVDYLARIGVKLRFGAR